MAQRKTPPPSKAAAGATNAAGKPAPKKTTGSAKSGPAKSGVSGKSGGPGKRPPTKGRSIVNQRQTPWALIITTLVIVIFAGGIVSYAVLHKSSSSSSSNPWAQPEIADAKAINGLIWKAEPDHTHVFTTVNYNTTPPTGGNHSQVWADCSGTVYPNAIANENAVHMLEHGAVWITYKPGLAADQVATLTKLVDGVDRMALSPYPGLKTNISLQAWGYQLFVDNASDPRIQEFINALKFNPKTTPETQASCVDAAFKANPSTFGHPTFS
jgi:hypothetical protein